MSTEELVYLLVYMIYGNKVNEYDKQEDFIELVARITNIVKDL